MLFLDGPGSHGGFDFRWTSTAEHVHYRGRLHLIRVQPMPARIFQCDEGPLVTGFGLHNTARGSGLSSLFRPVLRGSPGFQGPFEPQRQGLQTSSSVLHTQARTSHGDRG